ncbi:MAG: methyltransferase domain-containing protein [Actinomycetes bacterium]
MGIQEVFCSEYWEARYSAADRVWSGRPNRQLVAEAADLRPGEALDAGCGEGADAIWLAERGWRVTAVDFAAAALRRGERQAESLGAEIAGRIRWRQEDLTVWTPPERRFDLVNAEYVHFPPGRREPFFRSLAAAVAPGGTLLVVGHHPADLEANLSRPPVPELFFTAEDVAAVLDPAEWEIEVAAARPVPATDRDGRPATAYDAVLRARRRA